MMIKLDNISKYYYASNSVVPALRKIKLEFNIGEFVAITGESGSGKSTLLNVISGLDTYDDGELYIDGKETSYYDGADWEEYRKNKIGFVFQNYNLIEHYSVMNNVESALLIQGYGAKEAKAEARELINKVGLSRQLHQRASKLSSGQKQRLSIARALAKNTDIIIADEPTGNLDSDNGRQIMELLYEISKQKLIITVTHNIEEAISYITRKVRLHDGEVVADDYVKNEAVEELAAVDVSIDTDDIIEENPDVENVVKNSENKQLKNDSRNESNRSIAWRFTLMNITTQPGRVFLFMLLLLMTAAASFLFLGQIYSNWDDIYTKEHIRTLFTNIDETRIVVRKPDDSPITGDDIKKLNKVKYVKMADPYDYANDINFYFIEGTDYTYLYQAKDDPKGGKRLVFVDLKNKNKFMKSSSCLNAGDLAAGRLPESRNEVVVYSKDRKVLGTKQGCFFDSMSTWGFNEYYKTDVKIVGLLKKKTDQVYFSDEMCHMLSLGTYDDWYKLLASKNVLTNSYTVERNFIPVIGDDLKYGELRVSEDLAGAQVAGDAKVIATIDGTGTTSDAKVLDDYNPSSIGIAEMSEDWFNQLYQKESNQVSVYMKDYIYTDYVLDKIISMGYDAVSPFRVSAANYIYEKRMERNTTIFMSLIILALIGILELIIIRAIMRIRNKDFTVLGSIGMNYRTITMMNYFEMFIYTVLSIIIVIAGAWITVLFRNHFLVNMMKYYNILAYTIFIVFNIIMITMTVWLFNRYLKHKQKWSLYDKNK